MQIITILGSPRRQGNTAKVLGWIEDQLRADGHAVEHLNILDYAVAGCMECMACKRGKAELCAVEDDGNEVLRRMVAADLVLIAAPLFCWGFPAQIKGLIDRMYCLMDFDQERPSAPRLHGKPIGLVVTAGGDEEDNAELLIRGFENLVDLVQGRWAGHLLVPGCTTPEALTEDIREQVVGFARTLVSDELTK
jgi:multimeric flavodoxin WrbA